MLRELLDGFCDVPNILPQQNMRLSIRNSIVVIFFCALAMSGLAQTNDDLEAGPLYARFPLTLAPGWREEAAGPLFYTQESGAQSQWALPPLFAHTRTSDVDWTEWELLYPLLTYRRFGAERQLDILVFLSFYGGKSDPETGAKQVTFFPFYFQQRAPDPNLNYTALVPFYGTLKNRLFRDQIHFILFPLYSETRKRDVVTDNYLYPIFDLRHGDHMRGWQFWPLIGAEHKTLTFSTNNLNEQVKVGGYDKLFVLWPIFSKSDNGIGTTNEEKDLAIIPFYRHEKSPLRELTSYGWPLGYNIIDDQEKKYVEHDICWPAIVTAHGTKEEFRIFPFYSHAKNPSLESDFYLWPVLKINRLHSAPLERRRTRVLFFLYSDTVETNTESKLFLHRVDCWPLWHYDRDTDGHERLQVLAVMEPFFPNNRSVTREYSPVWSLWRSEKNAKNGATSQSLLHNLYRRETTRDSKKVSLLFGLFQYQRNPDGRRWRVCYVTVAKKAPLKPGPK